MRAYTFKTSLIKSGLAAFILLLTSGVSLAASVNLTVAPTQTRLPDGQTVPMWGYTCGATNAATCAASNPGAGSNWSPVVITVQSGTPLTINLTNNLSFATGSGTNTVPTSLVIVGQLGGGLGTSRTTMPSPVHAPQGTTWPGTPGDADASSCLPGGDPGAAGTFCPPAQAPRVRSLATEVVVGTQQGLTWNNLRPGTYLIESGTQPSIQGPMGLYGVLVVTDVNYPGQTFDKDVALLLSEIDQLQNAAVDAAVRVSGFSDTTVWSGAVGACGDVTQPITTHTCYPPAVNYDPRYYLINGVSFDRNTASSALTVPAVPETATTGRVLLRLVNAGLRMHVPSVVNANMTLLAEDGNKLPGVPKVQSELFLAAGKTYDVTIQPKQTTAGTYDAATYAVFDRALGLSTNNQRDGGMQAYINVAGGAAAGSPGSSASNTSALAVADNYFVVTGNTLNVSDPAKGLLANDVGIYGAAVSGVAPAGLTLNANGTFTYTGAPTTFTYCGNGAVSGSACNTVTMAACTGSCLGSAPIANADSFSSNVASRLQISRPGVLANDSDPSGYPLKAVLDGIGTCASVQLNADGSFTATSAGPVPCTFTYNAVNSQNTASAATASVALSFPTPSNLLVNVKDGKTGAAITDYRWIIEEDRTVYIDPTIETAPGSAPVRNLAVNFHTSHMPVVAEGCVGDVSCESGQTLMGTAAVCDIGNGVCRTDASKKTAVDPGQVHLDSSKRYYISILPGDGSNPIIDQPAVGEAGVGHTMGGAQIAVGQTVVDVYVEKTPLEPAKIAVFVFQDDNPLNGEHDGGGGTDIIAPNEPGLGGFSLVLLDQAGAMGDSTGQITYDMFGMPVSNALAGTIDPTTGLDACPISKTSTDGLVGMIMTCPKFESDGTTMSPLSGHALIANMYPGLYEVVATPGHDRIARGEEWLQTNTLDGTKAIEAFIKAGEPGYFQEFGPGGFHVAVGFVNPKVINDRKAGICAAAGSCSGNFYGKVTATRMSRTPDQRVYSSGSNDAYSFTQCYVGMGAPDSEDFAFTKCDPEGNFEFTGIPSGNLRVTVFDQWNDLLVDGLSTPIKAASAADPGGSAGSRIEIPVTQWRTNLYGRVFLDQNGDGVSQESEPGLPLVPYNIRYRDGSYAGFNNTDLNGYAGFNEVFPFLNWLVVDIDNARHKLSGVHVVYDAGGPVDGTTGGGSSTIAAGFANTKESSTAHLPVDLRVPGARYCADADCTGTGSFDPASGNPGSSGRVDPPWASTQGWQGLLGQNSFVEFAMKPFAPGENGGIKGHVLYTPTRPFDDPALLLQLSWAPGVPNVTVNLYKEDAAPDGTKTLKLVDKTTSTSWDDWAQGFRSDGKPNMNCPGQETGSPFYFTMEGGTQALNPTIPLAENGRFKCYDGWSMLNQVQPAPYNGMYKFPSVTARDPLTGKPTATNCTNCIPNTAVPTTDYDRDAPMLPPGKYVVEVIVPQGYELVKEEDKNILLGDAFIAPVAQQFGGFGNIFIMPDQAAVNAYYNPTNSLQRVTNNGAMPRREGDTGSVEVFWPCVGEKRIVPDFNSLFPGAGQAAPFAGASRPMCDRKEVVLEDQMSALAKFYIFSSTHVAGHFTGTITNDFASEFDPFSPQFGEKFGVPNAPVALKDFTGKEVARVYGDQWGIYNGMNFSTYTVNPPSPSGYIPQMMIACMNDPGPIPGPNGTMITDPAYNPAYSNFCYEIPFMPGQTAYLDTPVVPTMAFAAGYNLPDCEYPDTTPAIKSVLGSAIAGGGSGPWVSGVSAAGRTLTINALGDKQVLNHAYSGPMATTAPFNKKFITRHYGFGARPTTCPTSGNCPNATIGGVPMTNVTTWTDTQIVGLVPVLTAAQSSCTLAQRTTPTNIGTSARCGQLEITAANGKKSVDTVTVTVGGKAPTYVTPDSPSNNLFGRIVASPLQSAIDQAVPGDLIIVGPGTYHENLLMWKPVRLQGVAAESVIINADAHPAGKLDSWRRQVNCLFGLTLDGRPANAPYGDCPATMFNKVDRNNREGIIGWDATTNGNLAQQLQEPTLMGAYEGAGVTVLGKGVRYPRNEDPYALANAGAFPAGTEYLTGSNARCSETGGTGPNAFDRLDHATSNFHCNPARIDGFSVINSSQGGGGIFLHGWNHDMDVSNNRVYANHGTLTGGITVGSSEFTVPYIAGGVDPIPFNVPNNTPNGTQLGYGMNTDVHVHHNAVTGNASIGDALYSTTPSGGGGVTFCTGSDSYQFNNNWVCGNLSAGDGGGVAHLGFTNDGVISHNQIIFNQSQSATIPTNGGGLAVLGASPDRTITTGPLAGQECGTTTDADCPPGLPEGTGRNLLIDANLIMGNSAESGSGGGLRLQMVNGDDVIAFPTRPNRVTTGPQNGRSPGWNDVTVTNNIITNNVAGWDGGGVSMQDALKVKFINNTVVANDTTASAGVLFNTLGATTAAVPPPGCSPPTLPSDPLPPECINPVKTSTNQAAGLVTMQNTPNMTAALPPNTAGTQVSCPSGYGYGTGGALNDGSCRSVSLPLLANNVFWQNRAFHIEVGSMGSGQQEQQKVITLVPTLSQTFSGQIVTQGTDVGAPGSGDPVNYWDIGVRGDIGPTNHGSGFTLTPQNSILSSGGYPGNGNLVGSDPAVLRQYSNGARIPPEGCTGVAAVDQPRCKGYNAPVGRSEFTGLPVVFSLNQVVVAATVDEGNNWINLGYGPLSSINPVDGQTVLGNYAISAGSPAINTGTNSGAPNRDFFNNVRPLTVGNPADIGAVEFALLSGAAASVSPSALDFGNVGASSTSTQTLTLHNNGTVGLTGISVTFTGSFSRSGGSCGTTLASGTCTINVVLTAPSLLGVVSGTATVTANTLVSGSPVALSGNVVPPPVMSVTGGPLSFGGQLVGTTSSAQTLTLTNTGGSTFTGLTVAFPPGSPYSRLGGTCGVSLAAGNGTTTGICTITVVFSPVAAGPANSSVAITGNVLVTGSPVTLTATGTAPTLPALGVLDNFDRANANTLGANWSQAILFGSAAIRANSNQAFALLAGNAYWNVPSGGFGNKQGAAFTIANTTLNGDSLVLKATGTPNFLGIVPNFIRVRATGTQVIVETTTNNGGTFTTQANFAVNFTSGDTLMVVANPDGSVDVWKGSTYVGRSAAVAAFTGSGRIGIQLPTGARVDNFVGGTVP